MYLNEENVKKVIFEHRFFFEILASVRWLYQYLLRFREYFLLSLAEHRVLIKEKIVRNKKVPAHRIIRKLIFVKLEVINLKISSRRRKKN